MHPGTGRDHGYVSTDNPGPDRTGHQAAGIEDIDVFAIAKRILNAAGHQRMVGA
jgi:hypothetical protein